MPTKYVYPKRPRWYRLTSLATRLWAYGACLLVGLSALFLTPTTIEARLPQPFVYVWGVLLVVGSAVCLLGVAKSNFRYEMSALPFVQSGFWIYVIAVVDITHSSSLTRAAQAFTIVALLGFQYTRLAELIQIYRIVKHDYILENANNEHSD